MPAAQLTVGQTVVVQFGPSDNCLTRCEIIELADAQMVLAPFDPLSGEGKQGDAARLSFSRAGQLNFVDSVFARAAEPSRLVVVPERRTDARRGMDLRLGMTVVGEATPVLGQLRDLSLGGARAHLAESLTTGLRAVVRIFDDRNERVRVVGEVVGVSASGSTGARDTHVQFVDISDTTLEQLRALVERGELGNY